MNNFLKFVLLSVTAIGLGSANAQIIIGNVADATPESSNNPADGIGTIPVRDSARADGVLRVGAFGTSTPSRRAMVTVFELPTLSLGQTISAADFSLQFFSKNANPGYNVDLWALRVDASSPTVLSSDYGAGPTPEGPTTQELIQGDFITTTTATGRIETNTAGDSNLVTFLNDNWQNGGYVFIRANVAGTISFNDNGSGGTIDQGYNLGAAERPTDNERPQLSITIIPEPSSVVLLVATGAFLLLLRRRRA